MAQLKGGSTIAGFPILHMGNLNDVIRNIDGTGSGVDADMLDGYHASHFATQANLTTIVNEAVQTADMSGTTLRLKDGAGNIESSVNLRTELDKVYLNLDGSSINNVMNLPMLGRHENSISSAPYVKGGTFFSSQQQTGYIQIKLPVNIAVGQAISFIVNIYSGDGESIRVFVAGALGSGWTTVPTAHVLQNKNGKFKDLIVRFGDSASKATIWIGASNSVWKYPRISISDINTDIALNTVLSGWNITITTALGNVSREVDAGLFAKHSAESDLSLNSDKLSGQGRSSEATANTVVSRDANGDMKTKTKLLAEDFSVEYNSTTESIDFKF